MSWVNPGHIYPVCENHQSKDSLMGKELTAGHDSHYVVVNETGLPPKSYSDADLYDELVIKQENQIMPAYLISLKTNDFLASTQEKGLLRQKAGVTSTA